MAVGDPEALHALLIGRIDTLAAELGGKIEGLSAAIKYGDSDAAQKVLFLEHRLAAESERISEAKQSATRAHERINDVDKWRSGLDATLNARDKATARVAALYTSAGLAVFAAVLGVIAKLVVG